MADECFSAERFFTEITTAAEARTLLGRSRFQGEDFHCPRCHIEQFYALATRAEVRTCKGCQRQLQTGERRSGASIRSQIHCTAPTT